MSLCLFNLFGAGRPLSRSTSLRRHSRRPRQLSRAFGQRSEQRMRRVRLRWGWLITFAIVGLLALAGYLAFPRDYSSTAKGSPQYAAKWRTAFEGVGDPEEAQRRYPEAAAKRFENGEWVFGVCRDSHTYQDGGTIVVKDSTGAVR